ncbi:hypothetical protein F4804DRAFT_339111 [Jackrogersella minutella]|nr:hypothetical protein F4804DRAFT_339111 [Jackrogersella minutella]
MATQVRNMPESEGRPPSDVDISSIGVAEKFIRRSYGTPEAGFEGKATFRD